MQGQDVDITTTYSDYRKTDVGYVMPYEMDLDFGGQFQLSIAIKKAELNKTIDPAIFEMPKPAAAPAAPASPARSSLAAGEWQLIQTKWKGLPDYGGPFLLI